MSIDSLTGLQSPKLAVMIELGHAFNRLSEKLLICITGHHLEVGLSQLYELLLTAIFKHKAKLSFQIFNSRHDFHQVLHVLLGNECCLNLLYRHIRVVFLDSSNCFLTHFVFISSPVENLRH